MLTAVIAVISLTGLKAQSTGFEAGAFIGFPMGDFKESTSINFGITAAYYWTVAENFQAGVMTGYDYWTAKEFEIMGVKYKPDGMGFIPVTASAKYDFGGFFGGADLGYAVGVSKDNDGGFYYRPRLGYNAATFDAYAFYKGISKNGATASSIGLGFDYKF